MSDAAKDASVAPNDASAAAVKRTADAAEIGTKSKAKRTNDGDPLNTLSLDQRRAVLQACGQTLALHAASKIKGALVSEHIRSLSLSDLASTLAKLSAGLNGGLVAILLHALATPDLWLYPVGTECLVFVLLESPCGNACMEPLMYASDLRVLNAKSAATGDTLLHRVVERLHHRLVMRMLERGVDVLPNNRGYHALYAPLIEAIDDVDVDKMSAIITAFNCARQVRPGLFDPNAVVGGETFLGLLCRLPYPKLLLPWLNSLDCDLMIAPGKMIDASMMPPDMTIEDYKLLSTSVLRKTCGINVFRNWITKGAQLRGQQMIVIGAVWNGRTDIIREVIRQKAIFMFGAEHTKKSNNLTPLEYICFSRAHVCRECTHSTGNRANDFKIAALIIDNLPNFKDNEGCDALRTAIVDKQIDFIKLFINRGAKTTGCPGVEHPLRTAMRTWADDADDEIVRLLVQHGARWSWSECHHELVVASNLAGIGPLRVLLEGDNPPDALAGALETACTNKKIEFVRLLLEHKAPCSTKTLRAAAESADRDIVALILAQMPRALPDEIIDLVASVAAGPSKAACSHKP